MILDLSPYTTCPTAALIYYFPWIFPQYISLQERAELRSGDDFLYIHLDSKKKSSSEWKKS